MVACIFAVMPVNPYEAPAVTEAEAPMSRGWEIRDGMLLVEKEAILPMVDPYTGGSEDRMILLRVEVRRRDWWPRIVFLVCVVAAIVDGLVLVNGITAGHFLAVAVLVFIAGLLIPLFSGRAFLDVFVTSSTYRRHRFFVVGGWLSIFLLVLLFIVPSNLPVSSKGLATIFAGALGLAFVVLLVLPMFQRRIFHKGRSDGRFRLAGIHPRAMEALLLMQDQRSARRDV